jgi:tricorn protease-like protein
MPNWNKVVVSGSNASLNSLTVSNGITGSLLGTASYATQALSASYAPSAGGAAFPFTGSAQITGSLGVTGSVSITQNLTASRVYISSSNGTTSGSSLIVYGSGSSQPVFTVQGSQGELFSITDSLSGSLFSVNDISGLPILEVFSDNTTLIGDYQDPMLITTKKVTMTNSGSFVIYSLPTASYDTAFFDYSIKSGSNARAGQIMAIQSGSSVNFTETTTTDFGSTTSVSFTVLVSGSNMVLTGSAATGSWTIKSIIRGI